MAGKQLTIDMKVKKDTEHSRQFSAAGGPVNTVYVNKEACREIGVTEGTDARVRVIVEAV